MSIRTSAAHSAPLSRLTLRSGAAGLALRLFPILIAVAGCDRSSDAQIDQLRQAVTGIAFVQGNFATPQTPAISVNVPFSAAQSAGNLSVVIAGWNDTTARVTSVTDTKGNIYQLAVGPTAFPDWLTQSIYYAKNIAAAAAGANAVTVAFSTAAQFPDIRILEYTGLDQTSPLDAAAGAVGNSSVSSSGPVATTSANDLLVGANIVATSTSGPGSGFTSRMITQPDGDIAEDQVVSAVGSYSATAPLTSAGPWVMQIAVFKAMPSVPPPTAPTNLAATAASSSQINLSWTNTSTTQTGVKIERSLDNVTFSQIWVAGATAVSYPDTGLSASTRYFYRLRATNASGDSPYSNTASATTQSPPPPPTAPTNLAATAASSSQINLSWTNTSTTQTGVKIERSLDSVTFSQIWVAGATAVSYPDTGLSASTTYYYRVRATNASGDSPYSNTASATTQPPPPPTAPTNLTATAASSSQINLSWSNTSTTQTGVKIERSRDNVTFVQIWVAGATAVSYPDTGLSASTTYYYRVRATNASGDSPYSNTASAATQPTAPPPPTAPTNLAATAAGSSQINLSWTNTSTTQTGVKIERSRDSVTFIQIWVVAATAVSYSDIGLSASTIYYYRVRATNASGDSAYSNTASATTQPRLITPTFVQGNYATPQTAQSSVAVPYVAAQFNRDLNVVVVGWNDTTARVTSVTDTKGNVYQLAVGPTAFPDGLTQSIYYAKNIAAAAAGANAVTVTFSSAAQFPDIRILEYLGLDQTSPLDSAAGAAGNSSVSSSGPVATTSSNDLLVGANIVATFTNGPGSGFTSRMITQPDGDIAEDQVVSTAGSYSATAPLAGPGPWVMQIVAFKPSPSVPPAVTVAAPAAGATLTGVVPVSVNASASVTSVASVQLLVDGFLVGVPGTTDPYSFNLDTSKFPNGAHSLGASAWDRVGNVGIARWVSVTFSNANPGNPAQTGIWSGTTPLPIVAIHEAQLPDGKFLMWNTDGSLASVWDPALNTFVSVPAPANEFCSGHEQMAGGRIFVAGGHSNTHVGITAANAFDPATQSWTVLPDMAYPRWYPTTTILPDGRLLVLSGESSCADCEVLIPEIYSPVTNSWTQLSNAPFSFPYYPHVFVLTDGRVLVAATSEAPIVSQVLDLNARTWTAVGGAAVDGGSSAMYLPGKILKSGTSADPDASSFPSAATTYVLDMTQPLPTWRQVAAMNFPRTYHTMTMLPDGKVLVTGGGPTTAATDTANATLPAEMWSPTTETWTRLAAMSAPRLYHSNALLMLDGRVMISAGGGFDAPTDQFSAEFFAPPYLFRGPRPVIASAPSALQSGQTFGVLTPDAPRIASVSLIRFGSVTHAINMGQRFLPLTFSAGSGSLTVTAPVGANLAPPGNYMLFIVDTNGVPSEAATVHF